ncbi:beta-phosphoglucomutase [Halalkalibacter kiskunsagensis]|uniref:Beta-phosphoglucomutase n=1 Tax=Halalkalibacter kiskunsagensis TaxID=1548599 RepID=A0ABV6KE94_9BACI
MKQMKAVIFDMDGVISNTVHLHYIVNKKVADQLGIAFSQEWNQQLQGLSRRATVEAIVEKAAVALSDKEFDHLCELKNSHYKELINSLTTEDAQPGIRSFIEELKERGIPMVIASASRNANLVLTRLELVDHFHGIVDVTTLKQGKPDPEIFLKAAEIVDVYPSACVAIEDGEAGLKGIMETEMFSVGVGAEPALTKADYYIASTKELTVASLEKALNKHERTLYR